MKALLVWPLCWLLYGVGHVASLITERLDRNDDEAGWCFKAAFRTYQSTMGWSFVVQKWAEGEDRWSHHLPWGPPTPNENVE